MIYLDTNVILRYLLNDNDRFYDQAREYLENKEVFIKNEVLAEVVYVLNKTYSVPKGIVSNTLREMLVNHNIHTDSTEVCLLALSIFQEQNIDFVDGLLCAYRRVMGFEVHSFDKKLNRCIQSPITDHP